MSRVSGLAKVESVMTNPQIQTGMRVRVTQTIHRREEDWHTSVTGQVVSCEPEKTGSWYAHSPNGQLMLLRIRLQKDDGEISCLTLDQHSRVEILESTPQA